SMNPEKAGSLPIDFMFFALPSMSSLEELDVSGNNLVSGIFGMTQPLSLKRLNLSDNALFLLAQDFIRYFDKAMLPNLEYVDLSQNYLDFSPGSLNWYEIEYIEEVITGNQKNLSGISAVNLTYYDEEAMIDQDTKTVDLGIVLTGNSVFQVISFAKSSFIDIGDGRSYIAAVESPEKIPFSFEEGENSFTFTSTHANGDSSAYTVNYTGVDMPVGDAGINDPSLQLGVCSLMEEDPVSHAVTRSDMESLSGSLHFNGRGISDATGLEHATGIVGLYLADNNLPALPDLSGLTNLKTLALDGNQFTDVPETVNNLTTLQSLFLGETSISSLNGSIDRLENLKTL
ncbi:MAG: hypothetical protein MJA84_06720, partial [Firmicutes bacterium]|nr:hypothetical protein [Bacillota bacterium]